MPSALYEIAKYTHHYNRKLLPRLGFLPFALRMGNKYDKMKQNPKQIDNCAALTGTIEKERSNDGDGKNREGL